MKATNSRKRWYLQAVNHKKCIVCQNPIKSAYNKGSIRIDGIGVCTAHKSCVQRVLRENIEVIGDDIE